MEARLRKIGIIVFIIIMCICSVIALVVGLTLPNRNVSPKLKSIQVSSSVVDGIYRGGSGQIEAKLKMDDGSVSSPVDGFTFTSSNPDILSFNDSATTQTNPCTFKVTNSESAFGNDFNYNDFVTISVKYGNKSETIRIKITEATGHRVTFSYPDANNLGVWIEDKDAPVTVFEGYTLAASQGKEPDLSAWNKYNLEWIIDDTGEKYDTAQPYVWHDDIVVKAKLSANLYAVDYLSDGTESKGKEAGTVTIGEGLNNVDLAKFGLFEGDIKDDWSFIGWYTALDENGIENGLIGGGFYSLSNILYAAWTSDIYFDSVKCIGIPTQSSMEIIYNGQKKLPDVIETSEGVEFVAWCTEEFGGGDEISGGIYNGRPGITLYAKEEICVNFKDALGDSISPLEPIKVTYGKTMKDCNKSLPTPFHNGWTLSGWSFAEVGLIDNDSDETFKEKIENYNTAENNINRGITLTAVWSLNIFTQTYREGEGILESDVIEYYCGIAYSGDDSEATYLKLPNGQIGSWTISAWYTDLLYNNIFDDNQKVDETFADDIKEKILYNNRYGKYGLTLYAKWDADVTLIYGDQEGGKKVITTTYGVSLISDLPNSSELGTPPDGFKISTKQLIYCWETGEEISLSTIQNWCYPTNMDALYYQWEGMTSRVFFKCYSGGNYTPIGTKVLTMGAQVDLNPDELVPKIVVPSGWGTFVGYYYFVNANENGVIGNSTNGGKRYFDRNMKADIDWNVPQEEVALYAVFNPTYTAKLNQNGGTGGTENVSGLVWGTSMPTGIKAPTRLGYTFTGYYDSNGIKYYDNKMISAHDWDYTNNNETLTAGWNAIPLNEITTTQNNNDDLKSIGSSEAVYINISGGSGYYYYSYEIIKGEGISCSFATSSSNTSPTNVTKNKFTVKKTSDGKSGTIRVTVTDYYNGLSKTIDLDYSTSSCVAAGTLITLADGSQKLVEQLTGDEMLLVWNIYTGTFDAAPILFIDSDEESVYEIINLYFSNGASVKVISEHGFWDYNLNKWVFLRNDAAQYIGHWFNKQVTDKQGNLTNEKVQLIDVVITEEITTSWSPVTFGHLCYYVDGMLSMPGATEGFINIFDVDPETLKVNEAQMAADIEKYGLFTYEDFAEYIPEEVFYAFNGQYLKVAMGKGLLTWDDIYALIDRYQEFWQT